MTGSQVTFGEMVQRIVNTAGVMMRSGVKRAELVAMQDDYIGKNTTDNLDEDECFTTRDICYHDEDGYFFYVNRLNEIIKYKTGATVNDCRELIPVFIFQGEICFVHNAILADESLSVLRVKSVTEVIKMGVRNNSDGIIYGEQNFMIPAHMNYGKFIIDKFSMCKEKLALIDGVTGVQITFGEMVQRIVNTAGALMRSGVKRSEVVAICSENRMEFLITAIAVWCSGATVTFLNAGYSKSEMVHSMKISRPKSVFLSPDTYKRYYQTMVATNLVEKFYIFGKSVIDPILINFEEFTKPHFDVDSFKPPMDLNGLAQTAVILYSSGTTGLPKGAKLTHLNLITVGSQPNDKSKNKLSCLTVAPWSNTVGIICTLDELLNHNTVIYLARFKEEQYLTCIQKYKAGMLLTVPPLIVMFTKSTIAKNYDLSSVEVMYCGGAPLDLAVMTEVKQVFPNLKHILQGYGMTEASGALTEETATHYRPGSVGTVVLGNIIKIVDVETGKTLGPHQEGEVRIKGPALFGGYVGKNMSDDLDEDGFFKTGDICYYDEDGYFFFVDRIKELIKYKTGQVAPSELEAILLQHPAVKDAGVVGKPDSVAGELPTAFVVKKPEVDVTPKELIDFVATKVSSWKQLRGGVYFVEEIPKVPSGKILRRILRDFLKKPQSKL